MLIVPYGQDQPDNARRCVVLGVGEMIASKDYSFETAFAKLGRILRDPSRAENARKVSVRLLREDGTRTACDVIEGVLDDVAVGRQRSSGANESRLGGSLTTRYDCGVHSNSTLR
ncbi:MAG TPA: hypothetical protein VGK82_01530 [Pyrinomonadaceae bacterium]